MCLFKLKQASKHSRILVDLVLLSGFLWHNFNPVTVFAANRANTPDFGLKRPVITLSSPRGDRMFFPPQPVPIPDKKVKAVITAYSSTVDQCDADPFIAASGKHVYDGMIAANWLPLGTKVKIPALYGNKIFTVDDRMNPRYGYGRMDIWMDAPRSEVRAFGVQRVEVEIYYVTKQIAKK